MTKHLLKIACVAAGLCASSAMAAYDCNAITFSGGINDEACRGSFSPPPNDSIDFVNALDFGAFDFNVTAAFKDDNPSAGSTTPLFDAVAGGNGAGTITFNSLITDRFVLVLKLGNDFSAFVFDDNFAAGSTLTFALPGSLQGTGLSHATIYTGNAVPAIPEPETYALMLAGLAAVGFVARRRRQV